MASTRYEPKRSLIIHELCHALSYFRQTGERITLWHKPGGMLTERPEGFSCDDVAATLAGPIVDYLARFKRYPTSPSALFDNASSLKHSEMDIAELRGFSDAELEAGFIEGTRAVIMLDGLLSRAPGFFSELFVVLATSEGARVDFDKLEVVPVVDVASLGLSSEQCEALAGLVESLSQDIQ